MNYLRVWLASQQFVVTLRSGEELTEKLYTWCSLDLQKGIVSFYVGDCVVREVSHEQISSFTMSAKTTGA
jgi:hypothetical protein